MYPVVLDLTNRLVLVVGGGEIAARKIAGLLDSQPQITVISPTLVKDIPCDKITWLQREYRSMDVQDYELIFACTNSKQMNQLIVSECHSRQLVNNTSQKEQSTFYNMATVKDHEVLYGISTFGKSPTQAKLVKEELKSWLSAKGKRDDLV